MKERKNKKPSREYPRVKCLKVRWKSGPQTVEQVLQKLMDSLGLKADRFHQYKKSDTKIVLWSDKRERLKNAPEFAEKQDETLVREITREYDGTVVSVKCLKKGAHLDGSWYESEVSTMIMYMLTSLGTFTGYLGASNSLFVTQFAQASIFPKELFSGDEVRFDKPEFTKELKEKFQSKLDRTERKLDLAACKLGLAVISYNLRDSEVGSDAKERYLEMRERVIDEENPVLLIACLNHLRSAAITYEKEDQLEKKSKFWWDKIKEIMKDQNNLLYNKVINDIIPDEEERRVFCHTLWVKEKFENLRIIFKTHKKKESPPNGHYWHFLKDKYLPKASKVLKPGMIDCYWASLVVEDLISLMLETISDGNLFPRFKSNQKFQVLKEKMENVWDEICVVKKRRPIQQYITTSYCNIFGSNSSQISRHSESRQKNSSKTSSAQIPSQMGLLDSSFAPNSNQNLAQQMRFKNEPNSAPLSSVQPQSKKRINAKISFLNLLYCDSYQRTQVNEIDKGSAEEIQQQVGLSTIDSLSFKSNMTQDYIRPNEDRSNKSKSKKNALDQTPLKELLEEGNLTRSSQSFAPFDKDFHIFNYHGESPQWPSSPHSSFGMSRLSEINDFTPKEDNDCQNGPRPLI